MIALDKYTILQKSQACLLYFQEKSIWSLLTDDELTEKF